MRTAFFLGVLLLSGAFRSVAQGIQFFEGTWEEALELAKKQHKIIFVDAYTTWCGPCKQMAKEVFTQEEVGQFYNKNFINVKLDMEKGEGIGFGQKYQVTSFPTLLFINEKGEVVNSAKGSRPPDQFIALGKATLNRVDKSTDYEEQYEAGERSPEFLRAYAYSLLLAGKPTLKIANEYLRSQSDLQTPSNLEFLFDFTTEADSRLFDLLLQHRQSIAQSQTAAQIESKITEACRATARKAIEYQSSDLLREAVSKLLQALPSAKETAAMLEVNYYFGVHDNAKALDLSDKYLKKFGKEDAGKYFERASFALNYIGDAAALKKAEGWAKKAYSLKKDYPTGELYAQILDRLGKPDEAAAVRNELRRG